MIISVICPNSTGIESVLEENGDTSPAADVFAKATGSMLVATKVKTTNNTATFMSIFFIGMSSSLCVLFLNPFKMYNTSSLKSKLVTCFFCKKLKGLTISMSMHCQEAGHDGNGQDSRAS